jgi:hypothetical protein
LIIPNGFSKGPDISKKTKKIPPEKTIEFIDRGFPPENPFKGRSEFR